MAAAWVGNNDNSPMSYVASGVTGASPIWNKIISYALKDKKEEWPLKPAGIVGAHVCTLSGEVNQEGCQTRFEYFIEGTSLEGTNVSRQFVEIDKTTGRLATSQTPPENKELQERQIITDPLGAQYCLDCIFPSEPTIIHPADFLQLEP